jgi:hypothetical protein
MAVETRLIVVEGYGEKAGLEHMRSIANVRGAGFRSTIRCARGGSPSHIVQQAVKQQDFSAFDKRFVVFDADKYDDREQERVRDLTDRSEITVIVCAPNYDELILRVLGASPPFGNAKNELGRLLGGPPEDRRSYEGSLSIRLLNEARSLEISIDELLKIFDR